MSLSSCRYLFRFAHEHLNFRLPELEAIAKCLGISMEVHEEDNAMKPYVIVSFPYRCDAVKLVKRSVLCRDVIEIWGVGHNQAELLKSIQNFPDDLKASYFGVKNSFSFRLESFNRHIPQEEKREKIVSLLSSGLLPFEGKVDLVKPCSQFYILEMYDTPVSDAEQTIPHTIFFGRLISEGSRNVLSKFSLKKRVHIGNTSMDPTLAMIMCNIAQVNSCDLVFDPFVGSGSLLVAAAHYGAFVVGSDLDYNLLHGIGKSSRAGILMRGENDSLWYNLKQYNMASQYVDVLVSDASHGNMWRDGLKFDAIITDPPYGVREPAIKIGSQREDVHIPDDCRSCHIPQKMPYALYQLLDDLLHFAAYHLRLDGCLIYWLPVSRDAYSLDCVPTHPCLQMQNNIEQVLSQQIARRLICVRKTREPGLSDEKYGTVSDSMRLFNFRQCYFRDQSSV